MKQKLIFIVLSFLSAPLLTLGAESCYIELSVAEKKERGDIKFNLLETKNIYGDYSGFVALYNPDNPSDYILKTYDSKNNSLAEYAVYSSRFILTDKADPEDPGGISELNSGVINPIIPYGQEISKITIRYGEKEKNLDVNPEDFKCEKTCRAENEKRSYPTDNCCAGLIPAAQDDGSFICVNCGDGICSEPEDRYSCPEDCSFGADEISLPAAGKRGGEFLPWAFASFLISAAAALGVLILKLKKRKNSPPAKIQ